MGTKNVEEIKLYLDSEGDGLANSVAYRWSEYRNQTEVKRKEWEELQKYLFATSTAATANDELPWKNKTTLPKLTQIRDNLHANYLSSLVPNDDWMKWEAHTVDPNLLEKKEAIESYMKNKTRITPFRQTLSKLLLDYIDYGNAFAEVSWTHDKYTDDETGEEVTTYIGPVLNRISPYDIQFNATASDFYKTPKITRKIKSIGDLKVEIDSDPDALYLKDAVERLEGYRAHMGSYLPDDVEKATQYAVEGFGSYYEYLQSDYVELLEMEGDFHDPDTGEMLKGHKIVIADRVMTIAKEPLPSWMGTNYKFHSSWRKRPDNIWGMGPLENLVGMQYRIDHLENLKADVFDLIAFPPLKIIGDVEEFEWKPRSEIHIDEGGDVQMLNPDVTALNADTQIQMLEQRMEEYAGAPKQAMGIRTPGEKTAFEVQQLATAASRIFQEKITTFEIELLEPALNAMLEISRRNMQFSDVVRVMDDDIGAQAFITITKEDIKASGKIRPVGARHFAAQSKLIQDLSNLYNTQLGQVLMQHTSSKNLAKLVEDTLGIDRFDLFSPHAALYEKAEAQKLATNLQDQNAVEDQMEVNDDELPE